MTTPNAGLTEVPGSAFPEAEDLNESQRRVDIFCTNIRVRSETVAEPPVDAVQGDAFIVPVPATGIWAPKQRQVAYLTPAGWRYIQPREGMRAKVLDSGRLREYNGLEWTGAINGSQGAAGFPDMLGGINAELTYEIDLGVAALQEITLLEDTLLSFVGGFEGKVQIVRLIIRQSDAGGKAVVWPANTFWSGGSPPPISMLPLAVNVFEVETHDGGLSLYSRLIQKAVYRGSVVPPPYPTADDPLYSLVAHLLHFEGTDASQDYVDEKGAEWTIHEDAEGDGLVEIDTAQSKFGAASGHFLGGFGPGGSTNPIENWIETDGTDANDMTVGDWTIEGWIKLDFDPLTSGLGSGPIMCRGNGTSNGISIYCGSGREVWATIWPDPTVHPGVTLDMHLDFSDGMGTYAFSGSAWKHWHFGRRGNKFYAGCNGRTRNSDTSLLGMAGWFNSHVFGAIPHGGDAMRLGGRPGTGGLQGWMDDVRVTVGACRYVADYVPPTGPFASPTAFTPADGMNADGWPVFYDGVTLLDDQRAIDVGAGGGGGGGGGGTPVPADPDAYPEVGNDADDDFEIGTVIDTLGNRRTDSIPWTAFSVSTGTNAQRQGVLTLLPALTASRNVGGYVQPTSGSTWEYVCKMALTNWSANASAGVIIATASAAAGNLIIFGLNGTNLLVQRLTNATTWSANQLLQASSVVAVTPVQTGWIYLRVTYDGTTLKFSTSLTGAADSFTQSYSETSAAFLGTPARIGIGGDNEHASTQVAAHFQWFRRIDGSTYGSGGGTSPEPIATVNPSVDDKQTTPNDADDEFEFGASLDVAGARRTGAKPWSWRNQGTATTVQRASNLSFTAPGLASDNFRMIEQTLPASGAYDYRAKIAINVRSQFSQGGLFIGLNGGKFVVFGATNNSGLKTIIAGYNSVTTYGGYLPFLNSNLDFIPSYYDWFYARIRYDGASTWTFQLAPTGIEEMFLTIYSGNINSGFLGAAPDRIGLMANSSNSAGEDLVTACDWFRRYV